MAKSKIFQFSLISFILGAGGAFFVDPIDSFILFSIAIFFTAILIAGFKNSKIRVIGFCILSLIFGFWRFWVSRPAGNQNQISFYNNQYTVFEGLVSKDPDVRPDHTKLTVSAEKIETVGRMIMGKGNVLVNIPLYPEYQYGDQLKIGCDLKQPEKIEDFSYDLYLARYNIYSLCYRPQIELLAQRQGNSLYRAILSLKKRVQTVYNQSISAPQVSILSAMVLGNRRSISQKITDNFREAGTSHIIAISGMHITIIAGLLMQLGIGLGIPRNKTFYLSAVVLGMYVVLVGMPASAIRAATMGLLVSFSQVIGRLSRSINPLLFVVSVMILINPKVLLSDIGFQLSFLAVLGIIYLSPFFLKLFQWLPDFFQIRSSASMTMAAYLMTLPLIAYSFHSLSLIAIVVNILVLPAVPLVMIFGLLTGMAGLLFQPLGEIFGWLVWLFLSYIMTVINFFVQFDFASIAIEKTSWLILVEGYLVIIFLIWIVAKNRKPTTTSL